MKERPILFSADMVRAILDGRKTQTRRVVKGASGAFWDHAGWRPVVEAGAIVRWDTTDGQDSMDAGAPLPCCPYGQPGDTLWVREAWFDPQMDGGAVLYAADDPSPHPIHRCRPSIHMPLWASRMLLEVTDVRVERVQEISQEDAIAEGGPPSHWSFDQVSREYGYKDFPRSWFAQLWDHINTKRGYGWEKNPWVWAITFAVAEVRR